MLKEISRTTWMIAISSFILLTIMIGSTTKVVQSLTHKDALSVEINSEQIDTGFRLDQESKSSDTFTSFRTIPSTSIEEIDVPIYEWATKQEDLFYEEMEKTEDTINNKFVAHFNLHTDISKVTDDLFNVEMEVEQAVEQSEQYIKMKTFIVDLSAERIVNLNEIFDEEVFTTKERFKLIVEQLDEEVDYEVWQPALEELNDLEISLAEDKFTFYFNDKDLRKDNKYVKVSIPTKKLAAYFHSDYYSTFITEEMEAEMEQQRMKDEQDRNNATAKNKYIALTFDDGPEVETTDRILNILDQYDAKATFFMLSKNATAHPDIAKRVADQGHEIANHSITHANLNAVNNNQVKQEITESKKQIEEVTGKTPTLFRPPYGSSNNYVETVAQETNQAIAMWSIDTYDWQHLNANRTIQTIKNEVRPGSIILMHDIHATTADAVPQIMEYLTNEGYEFVTVSELLPYIEGEGIGPYYGN